MNSNYNPGKRGKQPHPNFDSKGPLGHSFSTVRQQSWLACLLIGVMLTGFSAWSQINYNQTFASGISSWVISGGAESGHTTTNICATTGSLRTNLWSATTSAPTFRSPNVGTSVGTSATLSYQYKVINYSGGAATPAANFSFVIQYGATATGPWTTIQTVGGAGDVHTPSTSCAVKTVNFTPPAGNTFIRLAATRNSGDFWIYLDDVSVVQSAATPCTGTPAPGNTISSVASACSGVNFNLSLQNATPGTGVTYAWQSANDAAFTSGVATVPGAGATVAVSQTSAKYYRATVTCGAESASSTPVLVGLSVCYCTAGATSVEYEKISNVTFNTINNNSTGTAGYQDFTTVSTSIQQGGVYPFSATLTEVYGTDQVLVWIDFNKDGDFTDEGELVYSSVLGGPFSGSIVIPASASLGSTRMRVRLQDSGDGPNATSCGTSTYGQVEDYTVNVMEGSPCSEPPTAATASISTSSTCTGQSVVLSAAINSSGTGLSFIWQSSSDGQSWSDISSATSSIYPVTATTGTTYFRYATTCGSTTTYSNPVLYNGIDCGSVLIPATGSNTVACGTNTYLYDSGGASGNYGNNQNGFTVLQNSGTNVISISGTLDSEANYDFLNIFSGTGTSGTLLESYYGTGTLPTFTFAPGQTITVQFTSDGSGVRGGFALMVNYNGTCAPPSITGFSPESACAIGTAAQRTVTISGSVFTGATAVSFNGVSAESFTVTNNTTISAVFPENATSGYISVTGPGGTGTSATEFTIAQPTAWYADNDADGFGNPDMMQMACSQPEGFVADNTDCDDANPDANPDATEILYNGFDDNCDGSIDEGNQLITQIKAAQCNSTLANIYTTILANSHPQASAYRFEITNTNDGVVQYLESATPSFQLTSLASYEYGTMYSVAVMIQRNGTWLGYYGPGCNVSTPELPANNLSVTQCGNTLANVYTSIAVPVTPNASGYRFRITNLTDTEGEFAVQQIDRNVSWFQLTQLASYDYGKSYQVEVAVKTTGNFSAFGAPCIVMTPQRFSTIKQCGTTYTNTYSAINAMIIPNVSGYRFRVTNQSTASVQEITPAQSWISFSQVADYSPNTSYTVEVAVKTTGDFGPYGPPCTIASSVAGIAANGAVATSDFRVVASPNPYTDGFALNLTEGTDAQVEVRVYDMIGKLLEVRSVQPADIASQKLGSNLPTGVYNVIVTQGDAVKTLKVIKR